MLSERFSGVVQRRRNVPGLKIRMLVDDVVDAHPTSDHAQHGDDREAKAPDAGLAVHLIRLDRDAFVDLRAHGAHPSCTVSVGRL